MANERAPGQSASRAIQATLDAVRYNCHISDARHAADYTLCVYLLKMREFYRWENDLPFSASLPHDRVTAWLTEREQHWDSLAGRTFRKIPVDGREIDPFDADSINALVNRYGYVYSSGYGRQMKPVFFLGELEHARDHDDYRMLVSGRELARDLSAPPAMSLGNTIYVRRESLRRMLWEKVEEWRWNRPANAMQNALACYDFENDAEASLDEMTDNEINSIMLHEIGEIEAGRLLGGGWEELLVSHAPSRTELLLRAVRDHLADSLSTLPALVGDGNDAALHFYMANMSSLRKELFPSLLSAYEVWSVTGKRHELEPLIDVAREHWLALCNSVLAAGESASGPADRSISEIIEAGVLDIIPDRRS